MARRLIPKGAKTLHQFLEDYGISERNYRRLKARNALPRLCWVTESKPIVRPEHEKEWLDARTDPAPAASPFPAEK